MIRSPGRHGVRVLERCPGRPMARGQCCSVTATAALNPELNSAGLSGHGKNQASIAGPETQAQPLVAPALRIGVAGGDGACSKEAEQATSSS